MDATATGTSAKVKPEMRKGAFSCRLSTTTSSSTRGSDTEVSVRGKEIGPGPRTNRARLRLVVHAEADEVVVERHEQDHERRQHDQRAPQLGEPAAASLPDQPGVPQRDQEGT